MAKKKPTAGRPTDYEFKSVKLPGSNRPARPITIPNTGQGLDAATRQAKQKLLELNAEEDRLQAEAEARAAAELEAESNDAPEPAAPALVITEPEPEPKPAAPAASPTPDAMQLAQMATSLSATLAQAMALEERLQRLNAESEQRLIAAEAAEAKAEQRMEAALAVTRNTAEIQNKANESTAQNIRDLQEANNKAIIALGEFTTTADAKRDVVENAASLVVDVKAEVTSMAAAEFSRLEEDLRLDNSLIAGSVGTDQRQIEQYLDKVRQQPNLTSTVEITDAMRAQYRAVLAQRTENQAALNPTAVQSFELGADPGDGTPFQ